MEKNNALAGAPFGTTARDSAPPIAAAESSEMAMSTWYSHVGTRIGWLISRFELEQSRAQIGRAYEILCRESLAFPMDRTPVHFSRLNHDGTPFQFSLSLGSFRPPLQFLSETGAPGASKANRMAASRYKIHALAALLGTNKPLERIVHLLDEVAPANHPELLLDSAAAFWIGVSFAPGQPAELRIYINGKWGGKNQRWARLKTFASHFPAFARWEEIEKLLFDRMQPLGMALALRADKPPTGRIYVSAYGNPISYYERVVQSYTSDTFRRLFGQYAETLMREDRHYPTPSAVCSFGLNSRPEPDFKFELCAHCLFSSDTDGAERFLDWLMFSNTNPAAYLDMLQAISGGDVSQTEVNFHCYTGFGVKQEITYSTVYLKPSLVQTAKSSALNWS
jgi:hypothetical protein